MFKLTKYLFKKYVQASKISVESEGVRSNYGCFKVEIYLSNNVVKIFFVKCIDKFESEAINLLLNNKDKKKREIYNAEDYSHNSVIQLFEKIDGDTLDNIEKIFVVLIS